MVPGGGIVNMTEQDKAFYSHCTSIAATGKSIFNVLLIAHIQGVSNILADGLFHKQTDIWQVHKQDYY